MARLVVRACSRWARDPLHGPSAPPCGQRLSVFLFSKPRCLVGAPKPTSWFRRAIGAKRGTPEDAAREIVRGRLQASGPTTVIQLGQVLGLDTSLVDVALSALEGEGFVLRGTFTPESTEVEWCERGLLARIHRYTLNRLRKEIEAVTAADYLRFLLRWQHATPDGRMEGPEGLAAIVEQLEGMEAGAAAWEADVLPVRMGRLRSELARSAVYLRPNHLESPYPAHGPCIEPPFARVRLHFRAESTRAPGASAPCPMSRHRATPRSPSTCSGDPARASSTTSFARPVCSPRKPKRPSVSSSPSA